MPKIRFRYYELYTSYCQFDPNDETIFESEYDLSDMKQYMEIRRWGPSVKELQPGIFKIIIYELLKP